MLNEKTNLLKCAYFFQEDGEIQKAGIQKVLDTLSLYMKEVRYNFRDTIFNWDDQVQFMYFIKEGQIKLLRRKLLNFKDRLKLEKIVDKQWDSSGAPPLLSSSLNPVRDYLEIGLREVKQVIGKEYFYLNQPSTYKAVVSSEYAVLVLIPFQNIEITFKSFEWYRNGIL